MRIEYIHSLTVHTQNEAMAVPYQHDLGTTTDFQKVCTHVRWCILHYGYRHESMQSANRGRRSATVQFVISGPCNCHRVLRSLSTQFAPFTSVEYGVACRSTVGPPEQGQSVLFSSVHRYMHTTKPSCVHWYSQV